LGARSDHGGPEYERLVVDGDLVLQLHDRDVEHDHGAIGAGSHGPNGTGVLLWFGEFEDFDGAVERVAELGARVVMPAHWTPPGGGGGPGHREIWLADPDGYTVVIASPDGEWHRMAVSDRASAAT